MYNALQVECDHCCVWSITNTITYLRNLLCAGFHLDTSFRTKFIYSSTLFSSPQFSVVNWRDEFWKELKRWQTFWKHRSWLFFFFPWSWGRLFGTRNLQFLVDEMWYVGVNGFWHKIWLFSFWKEPFWHFLTFRQNFRFEDTVVRLEKSSRCENKFDFLNGKIFLHSINERFFEWASQFCVAQ